MQERISRDDVKTPSDLRNLTKDKQILYLRTEIVKLEYQQLAESIVSIRGKTPAPNGTVLPKKRRLKLDAPKLYSEYEVTFDPTINVSPTIIECKSMKLLARYREDILLTSLYDATLASTLQFNETVGKGGHKRSVPGEIKPIKQIGSLFDDDVLGREIDPKLYGLCHHCKQIKPITQLVQCKYKSPKPETQIGKTPGQGAGYKGIRCCNMSPG